MFEQADMKLKSYSSHLLLHQSDRIKVLRLQPLFTDHSFIKAVSQEIKKVLILHHNHVLDVLS